MNDLKTEPTVCCIEFCPGVGVFMAQRLKSDLTIAKYLFCARHGKAYRTILEREYLQATREPGAGEQYVIEGRVGHRVQ